MRERIPSLLALFVLAVALAVGLLAPGEAAASFEEKKLTASDNRVDGRFGFSVAVSGDTTVVGAWLKDAGDQVFAGAAYVFQRDEGGVGNWGKVKKLVASDPERIDEFGYSVAISGDTVVVGAHFENAGGTNAGAVYVFERDEGGADNWGEVKKVTASDAQAGHLFGQSVAISGDTAVVGAYENAHQGAAYVFYRDDGGAENWGEVKMLTASDIGLGGHFGWSVAVSGATAVVASQDDAAYVFDRDEGGADNWGEVKKFTTLGLGSGRSVAVSGDATLVGSPSEGDGGAVHVFERDEGGADNWGEVKMLTASDAEAGDAFGHSVAVSDDTALVGADRADAVGSQKAGAAYVFERDEGGLVNWGEVTKLTASDAVAGDRLGTSVGLSGDTAVAGAPIKDSSGKFTGAAYVFGATAPTATPTDLPLPAPTPVGGVASDPDLGALPAGTADESGGNTGLRFAIAAAAAIAGVALAGAGGLALRHRSAR